MTFSSSDRAASHWLLFLHGAGTSRNMKILSPLTSPATTTAIFFFTLFVISFKKTMVEYTSRPKRHLDGSGMAQPFCPHPEDCPFSSKRWGVFAGSHVIRLLLQGGVFPTFQSSFPLVFFSTNRAQLLRKCPRMMPPPLNSRRSSLSARVRSY